MSDHVPWRTLAPGQRCRIRIWDRRSGGVRTVHECDERLYEAPNWTADGRLLLNGDGRLWLLPVVGPVGPAHPSADPADPDSPAVPSADPASAGPIELEVPGLPPVNNDHVLAPDGTGVWASAADGHIWHVPVDDGFRLSGPIRRVTSDDGGMHFLHGVSPDGTRLAYVHVTEHQGDPWGSAVIRTVGADGTDDRRLTAPPGPADGCEWTPDGAWILLSTEDFSETPGHAQIARIRPHAAADGMTDGTARGSIDVTVGVTAGGGGLEQLTDDERVNWFPHVAPAGDAAVLLSFPPGTIGHPADLEVELRLVDLPTGSDADDDTWVDAWRHPTTIVALHGGQGTINVPSWAPDGSAFAFVDYPVDAGCASNAPAR